MTKYSNLHQDGPTAHRLYTYPTNIKSIKISVSIHHPKNPKREVREIPTIANQSLQKLKKAETGSFNFKPSSDFA